MTVSVPFGNFSFASMIVIFCLESFSLCASRGCPDTYNPSSSFSHERHSFFVTWGASRRARVAFESTPPPEKREPWSTGRSVCSLWKLRSISMFASRVPRALASEETPPTMGEKSPRTRHSSSSAPHLMSDSSDFLFKFLSGTRLRKSPTSVKRSPDATACIIESPTPVPKFLIE